MQTTANQRASYWNLNGFDVECAAPLSERYAASHSIAAKLILCSNGISISFIIIGMSDETAQNMTGRRSFEERVFARFDALDSSLKNLDARLQKLEARSHDTKPIWEQALAEIHTVSQKLDTVEHKLNVLSQDMLTLRADQTRLEDRMDKIEPKSVQ